MAAASSSSSSSSGNRKSMMGMKRDSDPRFNAYKEAMKLFTDSRLNAYKEAMKLFTDPRFNANKEAIKVIRADHSMNGLLKARAEAKGATETPEEATTMVNETLTSMTAQCSKIDIMIQKQIRDNYIHFMRANKDVVFVGDEIDSLWEALKTTEKIITEARVNFEISSNSSARVKQRRGKDNKKKRTMMIIKIIMKRPLMTKNL